MKRFFFRKNGANEAVKERQFLNFTRKIKEAKQKSQFEEILVIALELFASQPQPSKKRDLKLVSLGVCGSGEKVFDPV